MPGNYNETSYMQDNNLVEEQIRAETRSDYNLAVKLLQQYYKLSLKNNRDEYVQQLNEEREKLKQYYDDKIHAERIRLDTVYKGKITDLKSTINNLKKKK